MKYLFMGLIRLYQWTISPWLGPRCKYWPSCSHYGYTAFSRHGTFRGMYLTAWRILRCNPWSHGGIDEVPPARPRRWAGRFGRSTTGSTMTPGAHPALAEAARPQGATE